MLRVPLRRARTRQILTVDPILVTVAGVRGVLGGLLGRVVRARGGGVSLRVRAGCWPSEHGQPEHEQRRDEVPEPPLANVQPPLAEPPVTVRRLTGQIGGDRGSCFASFEQG